MYIINVLRTASLTFMPHPSLISYLQGDSNVVPVPEGLRAGAKYHWAVDVKLGEEVKRGDVWRFTVDT